MKKLYRMFSGAAVAMLLAVVSSQAMAGLDLRFSFLSEDPFFEGEVSGTIFGLLAPAPGEFTGTFATSVIVNPWSLSPAVTYSADDFSQNSFSIFSPSNGVFEVDSFLLIAENSDGGLCLSDLGFCAGARGRSASPQQLEAASATVDFAAVPAPASLALLGVGLLVLLRAGRRARV